MGGWIKLHRRILESAVFTSLPPENLKIFLACLLLANNRGRPWYDGKKEVEIPRGSFVTSQPKLAKATRVSEKIVRGALDRLQKIGSIRAKTWAKRYTVIEVVNFETYQSTEDQAGEGSGGRRAKNGRTTGDNVRSREGEKKDLAGGTEAAGPSRPGGSSQGEETSRWWAEHGPAVREILALHADLYRQKVGKGPTNGKAQDGMLRELVTKRLQANSGDLEGTEREAQQALRDFFAFPPRRCRENSDYSLRAFRAHFDEIVAARAKGEYGP